MSETALAKILTLAEAMELAKVLSESDLVPKEYKGKPANCVIAIKMGEEIGLSPFQSMQSIAVINGKPSVYGDAGLGVVIASGQLESMDETDEGEVATCTMKRKGVEKPVTRTFSRADADRIQMWESDGKGGGKFVALSSRPTHKNYPKRMRQMRARWWVMRDLFPDKLRGLRGAEEIEETTIIDITPHADPAPDGAGEYEPKERTDDPKNLICPVCKAGYGEMHKPDCTHDNRDPLVDKKHGEEIIYEGNGPHGVVIHGVTTKMPTAPPTGEKEKSAMAVEDPKEVFELNGIHYQTNGITKDQMLDLFRLCPQANKKVGKKIELEINGKKSTVTYDKAILWQEFGLQTRKDMTKEQAEKYAVMLNETIKGE